LWNQTRTKEATAELKNAELGRPNRDLGYIKKKVMENSTNQASFSFISLR